MKKQLSTHEQKSLLALARRTIQDFVKLGTIAVPPEDITEGLKLQSGCFVTIHENGQLRGCIGNFISEKPLWQLVQEMAIAAATQDPRFYPMKQHDLNDFKLEISVLSPLEEIKSVDEIKVGTDGIYIVKGSYRGVLLPQVAVEYGWNLEQFLQHTCIKAGLPENAWQQGSTIYRFSAEIFKENR